MQFSLAEVSLLLGSALCGLTLAFGFLLAALFLWFTQQVTKLQAEIEMLKRERDGMMRELRMYAHSLYTQPASDLSFTTSGDVNVGGDVLGGGKQENHVRQ